MARNQDDPSRLNEEELKVKLVDTWQGIWKPFETRNRQKMGPMLYYLRELLSAPGCKGEGFEKFVNEKLEGLSIRTANAWATWWGKEIGATPRRASSKKASEAPSLGTLAETIAKKAKATCRKRDQDYTGDAADEQGPRSEEEDLLDVELHTFDVELHIFLTASEKEQFMEAMEKRGERASQIIFVAMTREIEPEFPFSGETPYAAYATDDSGLASV